MALELRQQLKLTQQLVMTPQLQQAIGLLQLSRLELLEKVQQELLENPFLEEADGDGEMESTLDSALELRDDVGSDDNNYDLEVAKNGDLEDYLGDLSSTPRQSQIREVELPDDDGLSFESRYAAKPSLASHLLWQLRLSKLSEEQKSIGECIVGNLNSMGYLEASDEEVAEMTGTSVEEVRAVARQIQRFDPVGVACRTPQECLLTQIEFLGYDRDPVLVEMVRDHLEDLESRRYKPLLRKFRLTLEDLEEYLNLISTLNPMPGASFGGDDPFYVSPDVFVYKYEGDFVIILNDDDLPQLHVSSAYEFCLDGASDKDKEYLNEKKRAAEWLIKSLHQRQGTLYKVMESIVGFQREFFEEGVSRLKPLILKDVADDIGMHESTVSRITTNKFVATPHGTFELKFFFNSALGLDDGSLVGSESVKALIKKMISEEDPKNPLSDERLGEILKEQLKVNIARRTVAKYRMAMDIESSSKRRKVF